MSSNDCKSAESLFEDFPKGFHVRRMFLQLFDYCNVFVRIGAFYRSVAENASAGGTCVAELSVDERRRAARPPFRIAWFARTGH